MLQYPERQQLCLGHLLGIRFPFCARHAAGIRGVSFLNSCQAYYFCTKASICQCKEITPLGKHKPSQKASAWPRPAKLSILRPRDELRESVRSIFLLHSCVYRGTDQDASSLLKSLKPEWHSKVQNSIVYPS